VNLLQLSANTLKHFISSLHSLAPPIATHHPSASNSVFLVFGALQTDLLTYLLDVYRAGCWLNVQQVNEVSVVFVQYPDDCCPKCFDACRCECCDVIAQSAVCRHFWTLRCHAYSLVEHRYFESFIIFMIVASSLSLVSSLLWRLTVLLYVNLYLPQGRNKIKIIINSAINCNM